MVDIRAAAESPEPGAQREAADCFYPCDNIQTAHCKFNRLRTMYLFDESLPGMIS